MIEIFFSALSVFSLLVYSIRSAMNPRPGNFVNSKIQAWLPCAIISLKFPS